MCKEFKEILNICEDRGVEKSNILLGNGFLLSGGYTKFSNEKILSEAVSFLSGENKERIDGLINNKKQQNTIPEICLRRYEEAISATEYFSETIYCKNKLDDAQIIFEEDKIALRNSIIDSINKLQPSSPANSVKLECCSRNLRHFRRLFTINYDLVLCWSFLKHNEIGDNRFKDAMFPQKKYENFCLHEWKNSNNRLNVHFLHGAIHLLSDKNNNTYKIAKGNISLSLKEVISDIKNLMEGDELEDYSPLIVLEGSSKEKQRHINNNPYLKKCLSRIAESTGLLIIYGCSVVDNAGDINNDRHIWSRIVNNKELKEIYISIHESPNSSEFKDKDKKIKTALKAMRHNQDITSDQHIECFSTTCNNIWDDFNNEMLDSSKIIAIQ